MKKVKLRAIKSDIVHEYSYDHAQEILRIDKYNDFEVADDKYKFVDNELIKQPSNRGGKKPTKSERTKEG